MQYKHIPATTGIPQHPYEGCTYCFIHEEAHTNVRFLSCDGHQLYELGVDLEVEGVRYIEMHRGPAVSTLHGALENGADLRVNERQKIRNHRARSTEERRRRRRRRQNSDFLLHTVRT